MTWAEPAATALDEVALEEVALDEVALDEVALDEVALDEVADGVEFELHAPTSATTTPLIAIVNAVDLIVFAPTIAFPPSTDASVFDGKGGC